MTKSLFAAIGVGVILIAVITAVTLHKPDNSSSNTTTSSAANSTASGASQSPAAGTINIRDMMFTPSQITIQKGGTVTWTNNDTTTHTVIDDLAGVGGPNSGDIAPGSNYSFTFLKTGSFQYHCSIHPSMRGTIVVK